MIHGISGIVTFFNATVGGIFAGKIRYIINHKEESNQTDPSMQMTTADPTTQSDTTTEQVTPAAATTITESVTTAEAETTVGGQFTTTTAIATTTTPVNSCLNYYLVLFSMIALHSKKYTYSF